MGYRRNCVIWVTCLQFSVCLCSGPPEKPTNLTCVTYYDKNMTCWWNPGHGTLVPTTYQLNLFIPSLHLQNCIPELSKNSCTIYYPNIRYYVDYTIWVEAKNNFGKTDSDHIVLDAMDSVKPEPIFITSVQPGHGSSRSLIVKWENPGKLPIIFPLKYHLRYRMAGTVDWIQIRPEGILPHREDFTIKGLKPFTKYIVAICCMGQDGKGYWSDWSSEKSGTTSEDQPAQGPDLWIVNKNPNSQSRPVLIMWKELSTSDANGIILGYQLQIKERKSQAVAWINSTDLEYSRVLSGESYIITIAAYNSVGNSPESQLIVPPANPEELPPVLQVHAAAHNERLLVEWKAPNATVNRYIVEWCVAESDSNQCSGPVHWMNEPNSTEKAFVDENIVPFKRYQITVYPVYNEGPGTQLSIMAYLQQDSPACGPFVHLKETGKTEAELEWDEIPVNKQHGFITNYAIFYKPAGDNESYVTVGPASRKYTLLNLRSNTLYQVNVMASTAKGGTNGTVITFKTLIFAKWETAAIISSTCLVSLSIAILMLLVYFKNKIRTKSCQTLPDPADSHPYVNSLKYQIQHRLDAENLEKTSQKVSSTGQKQQSGDKNESRRICSGSAEDPTIMGSSSGQQTPTRVLRSNSTCLLLGPEETS
ncbi:interleukin-6 receptor subunit beta-like [Scyliorhinus canicula]|uniref:interleukin-6 receptor subunit beta-like n=1 Tax=Scyliorhinus canicula TaxID=7830 RepID=UPI0018F536F6|nr:interleukin-6 receptor subunit beta-like [Scyliorhinus canicula]XP_038646866.1 interleukin-6 receptor subunit beta-like [Scyliorhinus canicula]XP_038646867.1 interleukin-6 receptor subunit beta-like [Scyliorhinus canicula]XP_038646868.1 interleukin-6 receptor subunit beta-like [Scyliorhinus canicula]XP_038646869.1 interleukin-6 receptor subunit beta-like [Scyliorhinus canicula]